MIEHKDLRDKIKGLLGSIPDIMPIKFKGEDGYAPEYFNYNLRDSLSKLFSKTKEGAYENLYKVLTESTNKKE